MSGVHARLEERQDARRERARARSTTTPRARRALSVMLTDEEREAVDAAAGLSADPHRGKRDGSTSAWARRVLLAAAERVRQEGR